MEFGFNINNIFGEEVSLIDNNLRPFRNNHSGQTYKSQLCTIIDNMGTASARAQGLGAAITTASRLSHSDHHLYIMKDNQGSRGEGAVVGILKVGHKKLFVYDKHGQQHEMDPLCVLDFYVHESKQRTGCGKRLFEYMLRDKQIRANHLAIDRPSAKFINFLGRHYQMKVPIPQVNNFYVFEGFFRDRPAEPSNNRRRSGKPPIIPHRQNSLDQWQDQSHGRREISSAVILQREAAGDSGHESVWSKRHGSLTLLHHESADHIPPQQPKEVLRNVNPRETSSATNERAGSAGKNNADSPSHRAMGAHNSMYSRHPEAAPGDAARSTTPPMLRRDGPSQDYMEIRNNIGSASTYQNRRGHLVVRDTSPTKTKNGVTDTDSSLREQLEIKPDSGWNVFGVSHSPKHSSSSNNSRYQHTRLW